MLTIFRSAAVCLAATSLTLTAAAQDMEGDDEFDWPFAPPPPGCELITSDFRHDHDTTIDARITLDIPLPNSARWAVYALDGERIVVASFGGGVQVYEASSGAVLGTIPGQILTDRGPGALPLFGYLGRHLATVSDDGRQIAIWDLETVEPLLQLDRLRNPQRRAAFSGDETRFALAEGERAARIRVLDLRSGEEILNRRAPIERTDWERDPELINSIALNHDGDRLAVVSGAGLRRTSIWDVEAGEAQIVRPSAARWIWFSSAGDRVNVRWDGSELWSWSLADMEDAAANRLRSSSRLYASSTAPAGLVLVRDDTISVLQTDAPWDRSVQGVPAIAAFELPLARRTAPPFRLSNVHHSASRLLYTMENGWVGLCDLEADVNIARIRLPLDIYRHAFLNEQADRFVALTRDGTGRRLTEVRF